MERKFQFMFIPGTKDAWSESSQERKFSGANVPYWELSLPGAKVPKSEKAIIRMVGRFQSEVGLLLRLTLTDLIVLSTPLLLQHDQTTSVPHRTSELKLNTF